MGPFGCNLVLLLMKNRCPRAILDAALQVSLVSDLAPNSVEVAKVVEDVGMKSLVAINESVIRHFCWLGSSVESGERLSCSKSMTAAFD